jgi:hypothetical protein
MTIKVSDLQHILTDKEAESAPKTDILQKLDDAVKLAEAKDDKNSAEFEFHKLAHAAVFLDTIKSFLNLGR